MLRRGAGILPGLCGASDKMLLARASYPLLKADMECCHREGGGEQIAICQGKCVVYSGAGDLLVLVAGTDEYDELARA